MHDTSPRPWYQWRVTLATNAPGTDRFERLPLPEPGGRTEEPGPDGIRHELVARIRREIAEGVYDTEEKWLAAEEALLRRIESRM